jgi:SAM-dependent methyltransferase
MADYQDDDWTRKKIKTIIEHYGHRFFYNKRVLDLGCGYGDIGAAFARLGADVLCVDARQSNLDIIQKKHPYLKTLRADLDNDWPIDISYDIIISLDLLCHLKNFEKHFTDICSRGEHIILETEVCDSNDPNLHIPIFEEKSIPTLSFNGIGSILSSSHIEARLAALGAEYKKITDSKLNSGSYKYDWATLNTNSRQSTNRRLWFIHKNRIRSQQMDAIQKIKEAEAALRQSHPFISFQNIIKLNAPPLSKIKNTALCLFGFPTKDIIYNVNLDICDVFIVSNENLDYLHPARVIIDNNLDLSDTKKYFVAINNVLTIKESYERDCLDVYNRVIVVDLSNPSLVSSLPDIIAEKVLLIQNEFVSNSIISDIYGSLYDYMDQYINSGCPNNIIDLIKFHFKEFGTDVIIQ